VPADNLQAVARALVTKAVAHDVSAIKEILDGRVGLSSLCYETSVLCSRCRVSLSERDVRQLACLLV
jgi:hypothetical protein